MSDVSLPPTLVRLLRHRAFLQPDQRAFTFLNRNDTESHLTFAELDCHARSIAAALELTAAPGERALLLFPPGLELISAFFGCLYAGVVAMPVHPPHPARPEPAMPRLRNIVRDADPIIGLMSSTLAPVVERFGPGDFPGVRWLCTDHVSTSLASTWREPELTRDSLAFLQYTSGATAAPKGAMVSHGNLLSNLEMIRRAFEHTRESTFVSWLPPYHDMGLIGTILQPLYVAASAVLMPPGDFLEQPIRWLKAITRFRGRTSGGPNFAFDLCVRRTTPSEREGLDLSSWEIAFNGAEPVHPETIRRFTRTFAPHGFRANAFYPCYGLAEATLFASGGVKSAPVIVKAIEREAAWAHEVVEAQALASNTALIVSCGRSPDRQTIAIVDPRTRRRCPVDRIGEIWIAGPNVTRGYWNRSDETADAFQARIADTGEGPFLRTGDLGFEEDGNLFVTGRLKDLIIIRGRNHYPQDIERTVAHSHPALRRGSSVAFSIEVDGDERLVIVHQIASREARANLDDLVPLVRARVAEEHDLSVHAVVLVKPGSIRKTSSGKVRRQACRADFLADRLDVLVQSVAKTTPSDDPRCGAIRRFVPDSAAPERRLEQTILYLQEHVGRVLGISPSLVTDSQPLSSLGLDSLAATELRYLIETDFSVRLPAVALVDGSSCRQLASQLFEMPYGQPVTLPAVGAAPDATAEYSLSCGQQALWFLYQLAPESAAYNIAGAVRILGSLDVPALQSAFHGIVQRHACLRATFHTAHDGPIQRINENDGAAGFHFEDARSWSGHALNDWLTNEAHRPFDIERGPVIKFHVLKCSDTEHILLLMVHHLAADFWSVTIMLRDLGMLYSESTGEEPTLLPKVNADFRIYVRWEEEFLAGPEGARQGRYWREQLARPMPPLILPVARNRPRAQTFRGRRERFSLGMRETADLAAIGRSIGATLYMTVLAVFEVLLYRCTAQEAFLVGTPIGGRNRAEFANVVGYFVNTVAIRADLSDRPTFRNVVERVRHAVLNAMEHGDYPFALLNGLSPSNTDAPRGSLIQAAFLWHKSSTVFSGDPAAFALGAAGGTIKFGGLRLEPVPLEHRSSQFDLMLILADTNGRLEGAFEYNTDIYDDAVIQGMVRRFGVLVENIIRTPDLPVANVPMEEDLALPRLTAATGSDGLAPLSYHQERLWFIDQFETEHIYPSSPTYHNIALILKLTGPVDHERLQSSVTRVVARHSALRTRIVSDSARQPRQGIQPNAHVKLVLLDAAKLEIEAALAFTRRPFRLDVDLLVRVALIRDAAAGESLLVIVAHHAVADRASMRIVAGEVVASYAATGSSVFPSEPPLQFVDHVHWQRNLPEPALDSLRMFWRVQLGDRPPAVGLPSSRRRPAVHTFTEARANFSLRRDVTSGIRALSKRLGASEFSILVAGFAILLQRYARQDDIVIGTSAPCRSRPELEGIVGPIANLVVLRTFLSGNPTFRSVIARTEQTVQQAWKHAEMPFDLLVQEHNPDKDMSRTALFDVLLQFEEADDRPLDLGAVTACVVETNVGYGKYDLNLLVLGHQDRWQGILTYNADLYDQALIEQMWRHLAEALEALATDPEQRVGSLVFSNREIALAAADRKRGTAAPASGIRTLHELFESQASRTPGRVAVSHGDLDILYSELEASANQLARHLRNQGVKPGCLVAICVDRAPDLIVAVLGVLKSGGAYLPLDPGDPPERLRFMAKDTNARYLVTEQDLVGLLGDFTGAVTLLDCHAAQIGTQLTTSPPNIATSSDLAYCIFTSGSTGDPKGVLVEHGSIVQLMLNGRSLFGVTEEDVWTLFHSQCFDFSVWEIWGALLNGGRLVVVPHLERRAPEVFYELLSRERVTILCQTPSAFRELVRAERAISEVTAPLAVRLVIFGGEALNFEDLRPWVDRHGNEAPRLVNMYGITEATVHATYHPVTLADLSGDPGSVIGIALPDVELHLLDRFGTPVPDWVPGEIHVGGSGLARGYLGRPAQTAERFVPDPFSAAPGARLYKSGDLAYRLPDGGMVFLGRTDDQVKIRGFRIELGEIETALRGHPAVAETVVVARGTGSGGKALFAYWVAAGDEFPTAADLRRFLEERVPAHMVPTGFMMLRALPLTRNGKVDRKALPTPERTSDDSAGFVPPRNSIEAVLAEIWCLILGRDRVGAHDNFFDLGGHSLLATQVVSRIRDDLRVEVSLRRFFEEPTVAGLAEAIAMRDPTMLPPSAGPRSTVAVDRDWPLSFAQERLWFFDHLEPGNPLYNFPAAFRLTGVLDVEVLKQSLFRIIGRHEILRTNFRTANGTAAQVIQPPFHLDLPVVDTRAAVEPHREADRLASEAARHCFNLSDGPLLRGLLLRTADDEHLLILTMHHITFDGWSISILVRELAALYDSIAAGETAKLPALTLQYRDFARWQREWLSGDRLARGLAYWRRQLAGAPQLLELPTDHRRPLVQTFRGAHQALRLSMTLSKAVAEVARREGATLFMALLAAFKVLLFRYTGETDIVVGSPIANRTWTETEQLIGFFLNTLALRTDLSGHPSYRELLRRVRQVSLGAYAHQEIPFERLVEELQPERGTAHNPLFQVMFVLQNAPATIASCGSLTFQLVEHENWVSKFDLSLSLSETGDGLSGWIEYKTDLFEFETISRLIGHFEVLLESIVLAPDTPIDRLPILSAAEKTLLLVHSADAQEPAADDCLHHLFELQAERTPEAIAVAFQDKWLTYADLNGQSNQIAHRLRALSAERNKPVAFMLDDGPHQIAAMLGILKAGSAFVCLDIGAPSRSLRQLLSEVRPLLIVSQSAYLQPLASALEDSRLAPRCRIILLDDPAVRAEPTTDPERVVTPPDLAYFVLTSGSTGRPKAIMQSHRSFRQFVTWQARRFEMEAPARIAQWASAAYDASYCEIFGALCFGATLCMASRDVRHNAAALVRWIREERISWLQVVPSFARHVLHSVDQEFGSPENPLPDLRLLLLAGEVLPVDLARGWLARFPSGLRVFNLYGPSETVLATCYPVEHVGEDQASIPIGRAIDGRQILILDSSGQLCPVGIRGEIYIRSEYLSCGYLGRPEETTRAFLQNPLHDDREDPVYRTGDIGRMLPDGCIQFLGRADNQVKIRGIRIEVSGIESLLYEIPSVKECAVVAHDDGNDEKRLVAYVVPREDPHAGNAMHVTQYRSIFESIYRRDSEVADAVPGVNLRVWTNSYTGKPFSEDEIREAVEDTASRVLALEPRRVLDIGCGLGTLLFRIAHRCERYIGTEISGSALRHLQQEVAARLPTASNVEFLERAAHEMEGLEDEDLDAVILNDVAIYFPSIEYLARVLERATRVLRRGGFVFIGGVRDLSLLKAFHTSLELDRAHAGSGREQMKRHLLAAMAADKELVVHPNFFQALRGALPEITRVDMWLKGGRHHNEVTLFQYDVVLRVGSGSGTGLAEEIAWEDWIESGMTLTELQRRLRFEEPRQLGLRQVPNARLTRVLRAVELMDSTDGPDTADEIRGLLRHFLKSGDVDPDELWELGKDLCYRVDIAPSGVEPGRYDVLFTREGPGVPRAIEPPSPIARQPWNHYANKPSSMNAEADLASQLRGELRLNLPAAMVPSAFVFLSALPRTSTGKIDRMSLPPPTRESPRPASVGARTELERQIAGIWATVLRVEEIGIYNNFFDLGGHSLLAAQAVNAVSRALETEIPLRALFEAPILIDFANAVERLLEAAREGDDEMVRLADTINGLSDEQAKVWLEQLKQEDLAGQATNARETGVA
jgi:amino acid adenylation domain-containing protein